MCSPVCCDLLLVVLAVIFPPIPVWIKRGVCSVESLINILLCVLGLIPGLVHSWYIIAKYPLRVATDYDIEGQQGHISRGGGYVPVVVTTSPPPSGQPQERLNQNQQQYGSINESTSGENPPPYKDVAKK